MLINVLLLLLGFVLLIKGTDLFTSGSISTANNFKLSKITTALTVVSLSTTLPELAIAIKSIISGNSDIVFGTIIGSNIINILFVLGFCSVINPLKIKNSSIKKELPISLLISCLLIVLFSDTLFDMNKVYEITRTDGIIMIIFFIVFLYYLISILRKKTITELDIKPKYSKCKSIVLMFIGLFGIIVGSSLVVDCAVYITNYIGMSQRVFALTIIALGASIPELSICVSSVLKKDGDLTLGSIIGSNILNICIALGLPVLLFGGIISNSFTSIDLIIFTVSSIVLYIFSVTGSQIKRREGVVMLLCFVCYYIYVLLT